MFRVNILVTGEPGVGKSLLIKRLVSSIYPENSKDIQYTHSFGDKFEYSGQKVFYFNRCSVNFMTESLHGKENLYNVLKVYPDENDIKVNGIELKNEINIIENMSCTEEFIESLYKLFNLGSEDWYRLFNVIITMLEDTIVISVPFDINLTGSSNGIRLSYDVKDLLTGNDQKYIYPILNAISKVKEKFDVNYSKDSQG